MRTQKRRILTDEATGGKEKLQTDQIRLVRLNDEYVRFSRAAGLRTQRERAQVAGFGRGQAARATAAAKSVAAKQEAEYTARRETILSRICSDDTPKALNVGNQKKHILGGSGHTDGRSYISVSIEDAQALVGKYSGTGEPKLNSKGEWTNKEFVTADRLIGVVVDPESGVETPTKRFSIHYGKRGTHIVPAKEVAPDEAARGTGEKS